MSFGTVLGLRQELGYKRLPEVTRTALLLHEDKRDMVVSDTGKTYLALPLLPT
jgi:hypothetical protein